MMNSLSISESCSPFMDDLVIAGDGLSAWCVLYYVCGTIERNWDYVPEDGRQRPVRISILTPHKPVAFGRGLAYRQVMLDCGREAPLRLTTPAEGLKLEPHHHSDFVNYLYDRGDDTHHLPLRARVGDFAFNLLTKRLAALKAKNIPVILTPRHDVFCDWQAQDSHMVVVQGKRRAYTARHAVLATGHSLRDAFASCAGHAHYYKIPTDLQRLAIARLPAQAKIAIVGGGHSSADALILLDAKKYKGTVTIFSGTQWPQWMGYYNQSIEPFETLRRVHVQAIRQTVTGVTPAAQRDGGGLIVDTGGLKRHFDVVINAATITKAGVQATPTDRPISAIGPSGEADSQHIVLQGFTMGHRLGRETLRQRGWVPLR